MAQHAPGQPLPHSLHALSEVHAGQRRSSIETEPRTLNEDQMAEAKDAAVEVIETKDPEEATEIFTTPSEDAVAHQLATDQSKAGMGDKSEEITDAEQRQPEALSRPLLATTSSAPF